jgi:L,D-transpeptidase catalytic domain
MQMTSCSANPKHSNTALRPVRVALAGLALLISPGDHALAASARSAPSVQSIDSRTAGDPVMAIVSLRSQRIEVYDAQGWILRAPVSSGQKGRETPAGIFSVLQKDAEHYSNLYEDGYMPHMQRLTWSGIALHGGPLPGYPASHGCVRMPFAFAARLFGATQLGMRVIVAPAEAAPVEIAHPTLFHSKSEASALAAARLAQAAEAAKKADEARLAAVGAAREAAKAMMPVRVAENLKLRAEEQLAAAEMTLATSSAAEVRTQAKDAKAKALDKIAELQAQWAAAKADLQPKLDAVAPARAAAAAAEASRAAASQAAEEAARELEPVSMFISRKTQRLYVRRAFQPIWESPVTIQDADRALGTHVFTALERTNSDTGMRWNAVTVDDGRPRASVVELQIRGDGGRGQAVEPKVSESDSAKLALDRIVIPQDALDRIAEMLSPRSSLIVSDDELSAETGKDTEFVVILSGEPQGSMKSRRRGSGN